MQMVGGIGASRTPTDEERSKLHGVIAAHLQSNSLPHEPLSLLSIATQVVAGVNYFVKVKHGDNVSHYRIYEKLPCYGSTIEVSSVLHGKSEDDILEYF
uniref:Type I cysteine peptidase inhibitor n=1 Tax=Eudiplozoon nipponicum TaxID=116851 RepID=A0A2H4LI92_EUDNI|nr:type I cysteine peptidase inhibitor [Eudiplozoon nipponicum]